MVTNAPTDAFAAESPVHALPTRTTLTCIGVNYGKDSGTSTAHTVAHSACTRRRETRSPFLVQFVSRRTIGTASIPLHATSFALSLVWAHIIFSMNCATVVSNCQTMSVYTEEDTNPLSRLEWTKCQFHPPMVLCSIHDILYLTKVNLY